MKFCFTNGPVTAEEKYPHTISLPPQNLTDSVHNTDDIFLYQGVVPFVFFVPTTSSKGDSSISKTLLKSYGVQCACFVANFKRIGMLTALIKGYLAANRARSHLSTSILLTVRGDILILAVLGSTTISLLVFRRFSRELTASIVIKRSVYAALFLFRK